MGFFSRVIEYVADTSQAIIERLLDLPGVTKAKIARALGRDSSTISQIEAGKKPGANLAADLLKLERDLAGESAPGEAIKEIELEPPARLTREGELAAVRQSRADIEAQAEADRAAARHVEIAGAGESGMTVTIRGKIGSSKDFRNRVISADFEPDEAAAFLAFWESDRDQAYELFWEAALYPQLTVERLDSIEFS